MGDDFDRFLESISVRALGLEKYGFIDESVSNKTNSSFALSSDSSEENETSYYITSDEGEDETDDSETVSTSSSSSSSSDSYETDNSKEDSESDSSCFSIDISHPSDEIQSLDQGLLVDPVKEATRIIENISLQNKIAGSTTWKGCHNLLASDKGKNIWCSCKEPQSNRDSEEWTGSTSGEPISKNSFLTIESQLSNWEYEQLKRSAKIRKNGFLTYEEQLKMHCEHWRRSTKKDPIWKSSFPTTYPSGTLERLGASILNEENYNAVYGDQISQKLCNPKMIPIGSSRRVISRPQRPPQVNNIWHQISPVPMDYVHFSHNPETTEMWIVNSNHQSKLITDHHSWCTSSKEQMISTGSSEYIMVQKITIDNKKLLEAACCPEGSRKLLWLIRQLNGSKLPILLTHSLSYGYYMMMLDNFGWRVIKQCFDVFDCSTNEVLYQGVIHRFLDLATDKRGCISLNECIDTIKGPHRDLLLDAIADYSIYLSYNRYGNFVIQHVLKLEDPRFCNKICGLLRGNYARLSQYENGSHVVEKCLQKSEIGLHYLMQEIKAEPDNLPNLAKHVYGNYVIQQALLISEATYPEYFQYLSNRLIPLIPILENNKYGKRLAILLQDIARKQKLYPLFPSV